MQSDNLKENFPFKCSDLVRSKLNSDEYGEVCCISYTTKTVRVIQQCPIGKILCYDVDELELM